MVFNATFNNISVILWRSVLLVEETGVPAYNLCHWQTLSYNHVVSSTPRMGGIRTHNVSCGKNCYGYSKLQCIDLFVDYFHFISTICKILFYVAI